MPDASFRRLSVVGIRCKGGQHGRCSKEAEWFAKWTVKGRNAGCLSVQIGKNLCSEHAAGCAARHGGGTISLDQFKREKA